MRRTKEEYADVTEIINRLFDGEEMSQTWKQDGKTMEFPGDLEFDMDDATTILEELGVDHAKERVDWFNIVDLTVDEILDLIEVEFDFLECDQCGKLITVGRPESYDNFQGVVDDEYRWIELPDKTVNLHWPECCPKWL